MIHVYILRLICSYIFECPFRFVSLVHRLLRTFIDLNFDFAAPTQRFVISSLTSNMLVKIRSYFLALGLLTGVDVIGAL